MIAAETAPPRECPLRSAAVLRDSLRLFALGTLLC